MELVQSKSLLAKLMATENLIVEQRNVDTASFDVKNRVLTVPVLDKNISGYLYDLFMGHEVGHALYTPSEGMLKANELEIPMSLMNVLEDVRIERKIKNKYPGIRTSFVKGYQDLIKKDFFGINDVDVNEMNFIDRINMFSKGGPTLGIKFNDDEQSLLKKVESTESYDDVIEVAKEVMEYMKMQKEAKDKLKMEMDDNEEYEEDNDEDGNSDDASNYDLEGEGNDEVNQNDPDQSGKPLDDKAGTSAGSEYSSHTDENYMKNQKKLFASDGSSYYYGNIPDYDLTKCIIGHKALWDRYRKYQEKMEYESRGINMDKYQKIRKDAAKVVSYLAKEFELKKNAEQLKRASIAKTGELNMSRIFSYKFSEDIFKKATIVPDGKSHGLVMFLDWSGSMANHLESTVKQVINLALFCRKVSIPFEVYTFTSEYDDYDANTTYGGYRPTPKVGDIACERMNLLNILSSKMSSAEFTYAGAALAKMSAGRFSNRPRFFELGGTPFSECIMAAMKLVPQFQKDYKLQIVNTVFLTDGDGHALNRVVNEMNEHGGFRADAYDPANGDDFRSQKMVIVDPVTKNQEYAPDRYGRELTTTYIKMLKARTNSNIVGFYILNGREFNRNSYDFFSAAADHDKIRLNFRKNKYAIATSAGYDEYYLLRAEGMDTDDDVEFVVKENATTRGLVSAFSKYAGNRLSNRVVLNRFIEMIA